MSESGKEKKQELPAATPSPEAPRAHPNDPLHGITLQQIVAQLHAHYGWEQLGRMIRIRCFTHDPSLKSSLTFLRRHAWARSEVEALYLRLRSSAGAG